MINSVHIAAPYPMQAEARLLRDDLVKAHISVTSRWLDVKQDTDEQAADVDLEDVFTAQGLVLMNPERWANEGTGGRHVEVGAALTYGIPVYILGVRSNVFHTKRQCRVVPTIVELISALAHGDATRTLVVY